MKLEKLESLRGLVAIYVVLHHAFGHGVIVLGVNIGNLFRFGQEAVILFFLLSGFVINFSFKRSNDQTFRTFFLKRASRIYIPLIIVMFLGWSIECLVANEVANLNVRELLLNLLMLQDISSLKPNVIVDPYMHNSPLWSLSYEWWFYMLYFPIQKYIQSDNDKDIFVFSFAACAAVTYLYCPTFLPRLLMYMSIWWFGVVLSNRYVLKKSFSIECLIFPLSSLTLICLINGIGVYRAFASGTYSSVGVHPALELRHHLFAIIVVIISVFWKTKKWVLFDRVISPFLPLAPISYVIYISHYYFVNSECLSFLNNKALEYSIYLTMMLLFSYTVERIIYPPLQRGFLNITMKE
jgi:peptidoglycan/LPS O-acetylase OafA/YrhL